MGHPWGVELLDAQVPSAGDILRTKTTGLMGRDLVDNGGLPVSICPVYKSGHLNLGYWSEGRQCAKLPVPGLGFHPLVPDM